MADNNQLFKHVKFCIHLYFLVFILGVFTADEEDALLFIPVEYVPPPACPTNELHKECLNSCSNCDQRGLCLFDGCKESGCDCIPHFFRLTPGGPCQPVHMCPKHECGENEVFRECGPLCERCGTMRCRIIHCEHKCYCKEGYLRDSDDKCIPEEECPPRLHCSRSEEMVESGLIDEYCLHAETEVVTNDTQSKEQCYCKAGLKRSAMGHCMPQKFCEFIKCLGVEVYQLCPRKCNGTCRNYGDSTCKEDGHCYPGCFCPEGFLMNDHRLCVPLEECEPGSNPFAPTAAPTTTAAVTETPPLESTTTSTSLTPEGQSTQKPTSPLYDDKTNQDDEDGPTDKTDEKPTDETDEKSTDDTDEKPNGETDEKPIDETEGKSNDKMSTGATEKPTAGKSTDDTGEKPIDSTDDKSTDEKPIDGTDKSTDEKPINGTDDKSTDKKPTDGTDDKSTDENPIDGTDKSTDEKPINGTDDKSTNEKPTDRTDEKSIDETDDKKAGLEESVTEEIPMEKIESTMVELTEATTPAVKLKSPKKNLEGTRKQGNEEKAPPSKAPRSRKITTKEVDSNEDTE